jgi:hypothetical protein
VVLNISNLPAYKILALEKEAIRVISKILITNFMKYKNIFKKNKINYLLKKIIKINL